MVYLLILSIFATKIKLRRKLISRKFKKSNRKGLTRRKVTEPYRVNERIQVTEVRVISEEGNLGVRSTYDAIRLAEERGLDLVEVSTTTRPPVCKILNYSKFKYEQKKKGKENKSKSQRITVKEIRFGPNTDDHDFAFKLRHAIEFLNEGAKLKAYVHFVGRSIVFRERGEHLLLRFTQALQEYGKVEQMPLMEGKRMHIILAPLHSSIKKTNPKDA